MNIKKLVLLQNKITKKLLLSKFIYNQILVMNVRFLLDPSTDHIRRLIKHELDQ
jgi:hypothetical protein